MILVWLCLLNFNKCVYYIFDNRFVSNWSLIAILQLQKSGRLFLQLAIKYTIYTSADHLPWDTQLSHYDHVRCLLAQNRKGSLISRGCLRATLAALPGSTLECDNCDDASTGQHFSVDQSPRHVVTHQCVIEMVSKWHYFTSYVTHTQNTLWTD